MSAERPPVLTPPVELTHDTVRAFETEALACVAQPNRGIVLDMGSVRFVNSTGLGTLVKIGMRLDAQERRLALARPSAHVERAIRLVGLDAVLRIFGSVGEALEFLETPGAPARTL
jgi:anti-anti-sigma factor